MIIEIKSCRTCPLLNITSCRAADISLVWELLRDGVPECVPPDCPLRKHEVKEEKQK